MKIKLLFSCIFCFSYAICFSQNTYINPLYKTSFDKDSLKGFDEQAARASALSEGFYESEFIVKMYRLKREYIDNKFGLIKPSSSSSGYNFSGNRTAILPGCLNEDFEASVAGTITTSGQITGWIMSAGTNTNSCNLITTPLAPSTSELIDCSAPGGYIDSDIGAQYPIYSVFGNGNSNIAAAAVNPQIIGPMSGNKVLRLNDGIGNYSIEKLSKTFAVTANNSLFQYAFISAFAADHNCCDAPTFKVIVSNANSNMLIPCLSFTMSAPNISCQSMGGIDYRKSGSGIPYTYSSNDFIYNPWKINSLDLITYIGQAVTIDFIATDCTGGSHIGELYVDAQCSQMKVTINNKDFMFQDSVINYVSCDSIIKIQAPDYFTFYEWTGPAGITGTTSIVTTTVAGVYKLKLGSPWASCGNAKTINISFSKTGSVTSTANELCSGYPSILTAVGFSNCTWNTGDTLHQIYVAPLVNTTYSVSGINTDGCIASASITQVVTDCTGLTTINTSNNKIVIYPNPNNGEFTINIEKEILNGELIIETSLGQTVFKQPVQRGVNAIKTRNLPTAVYYYTVTENKRILSKGKLKIE